MISYRPSFVPNKVMIVGCGGTGSRLVPLLAQFIKTCPWIQNPEITLVDDDVVEEKNLQRQNFIAADVGKPKATVLATRYSRAFNVPIIPYVMRIGYSSTERNKKFDDGTTVYDKLTTLFDAYRTNALYVLCVDSVKARQDIVRYILDFTSSNHANVLLIDSGNENDFGQISVSTARFSDVRYYTDQLKKYPQALPGDMEIPAIPMDIGYFTGMKATTGGSCADLDQTMAINTMMAVTMFGVIQQFYYAHPITFHRINVTLSNGATPEYITPKFLLQSFQNSVDYRKTYSLHGVEMGHGLVGADFTTSLDVFHHNVYEPFRKLTEKATAELELEKKRKEAVELDKVIQQAIRKEMQKYGWEIPAERKAALSNVALALKAVSAEKENPSPEAAAARAENEAKQKPAKKKKGDYAGLLKSSLESYLKDNLGQWVVTHTDDYLRMREDL